MSQVHVLNQLQAARFGVPVLLSPLNNNIGCLMLISEGRSCFALIMTSPKIPHLFFDPINSNVAVWQNPKTPTIVGRSNGPYRQICST